MNTEGTENVEATRSVASEPSGAPVRSSDGLHIMTKITFDEAIKRFKANEEIESVLCLTGKKDDDQARRRVAIAWPKVPLKKASTTEEFNDSPSLWDDLWSDVRADMDALAAASGVSAAWSIVAQLRANRIIYPDGTIGVTAQKALRQLAKNELGL